MMYGLGAFAMVMMLVGMLFCFAVLAGIVWLVGRWFNRQWVPPIPYAPRQHDTDYGYEEGYHPSQQPSEISQEGGRQYHAPQPKQEYDQPQAQYPQEMPPQH